MRIKTTGCIRGKSKAVYWSYFFIVLAVLILSIAAGTALGSADISLSDVWRIILHKLTGSENTQIKASSISIVWQLRIPRVLLAIAVGGGLAVAGAAMQSVTQNILADPYILGASSGASAMVAAAYSVGGAFIYSNSGISLFAFSGSVIALVLVYAIGIVGNKGSSSRLVLAGMAVSVILNAVSQFFISVSPNAQKLKSVMAWTMGSLSGARWSNIAIPIFGSVIGSLFFILTARAFNLISLGDETALSLGINVKLIKKLTIIIVSLITGVVVAAGGLIGFVGFIIPHIIRLISGADHRRLFPAAFLTGGLFLLWMDILARTVMAPKELSIGILTALCGGPFFIWLLYKKNKAGRK